MSDEEIAGCAHFWCAMERGGREKKEPKSSFRSDGFVRIFYPSSRFCGAFGATPDIVFPFEINVQCPDACINGIVAPEKLNSPFDCVAV